MSLLRPMTTDTAADLSPAFWRGFPLAPANEHVERALSRVAAVAEAAADDVAGAAHDEAVEYTRLFVGPGTPPPFRLGNRSTAPAVRTCSGNQLSI